MKNDFNAKVQASICFVAGNFIFSNAVVD